MCYDEKYIRERGQEVSMCAQIHAILNGQERTIEIISEPDEGGTLHIVEVKIVPDRGESKQKPWDRSMFPMFKG